LIQQSWAFTCYLLQHFGPKERPASFYAERFVQAFPMVVAGVTSVYYREPDSVAKDCYKVRALERFLGLFGLAEFSWDGPDKLRVTANIRPTALMMDAVRLQVR